jgi:F-type H+-transporting ATPase subunit b|tara:strand:- start:1408 stop:1875 length:468 start_codon:yes stop_codon:yes gene_type:complete
MVNFSILISNSEVSGPGGLFDFNATLPLVAIQFVLLMLILNTVLYSPLLTIMEERKEYILNNLAQASEILTQANEVTTYYEEELSRVRKEGQLLVTEAQKIHKEILDLELETSQSYLDKLLDTIIEDLMDKQKVALSSLDTIVQSLCVEVENQLY